MLWSQGRKKGSEVLTQWESMCLACVRPQGKAGRGRKTTLESKAYSNSKNSCLPSPHFARFCWQVVTSWLWPAVLGYLVSLLAFPVETLACSAQPPATPWRLSYLVCSTLPVATPLPLRSFHPTHPLVICSWWQTAHPPPHPDAWVGVLVFCLSFQISAEFLKADAGSYSLSSPKVSTQPLSQSAQ